MSELALMISRLNPIEWGWVKVLFVVFGLMTIGGIFVRHRLTLHISLELLAFAGLVAIFLYGVYTRGVLGTAASHPHGRLYYAILIPHILSGMVYAFSAVCLMVLGTRILARGELRLIRRHRMFGRIAATSLSVSVLLALPL